MPRWTLADRFAKARTTAGYSTQQQLADRMKVSVKTIQRAEKDGLASERTISQYADVCNVPLDWLVGTDPDSFDSGGVTLGYRYERPTLELVAA